MFIANSKTVAEYARRFAHRYWSFLGPGSEKKWHGSHTYKPNGKWDRVAEDMMSRIPWIQCFGTRRFAKSIHFCGDDETVEVILRTIISVNGAVADMCDELAWRISGFSEGTGKFVAQNKSEPDDANRIVDTAQPASEQREGARKFAARL